MLASVWLGANHWSGFRCFKEVGFIQAWPFTERLIDAFEGVDGKETPARASEADTRHGPLGILLAQARAKKIASGPLIGPSLFSAGCLAAEDRSLRRRSGGG